MIDIDHPAVTVGFAPAPHPPTTAGATTAWRLAYLMAAVALLLAACSGAKHDSDMRPAARRTAVTWGQPPTPSSLAGVWLNDAQPSTGGPTYQLQWSTALLQLNPDGTYAFDPGGYLDTTPHSTGTYAVHERSVTFTIGGGSSECGLGDGWAVQAGTSPAGQLHTTITDDLSDPCGVGIGTEWTWSRVSPSSPAGAELTTGAAAPDIGITPALLQLRGIWLRQGSGHLLRFGEGGSYASDSSGRLATDPDDVGRFTVNEQGNVTFTSGAHSRGCTQGSRTVWTSVRLVIRSLQVAGGKDECGQHIATQSTWLRLSP
jgi:hypothetical protein